jgi:hypothetical protein
MLVLITLQSIKIENRWTRQTIMLVTRTGTYGSTVALYLYVVVFYIFGKKMSTL